MIYDYKELRKFVRNVWLAKCISGNIGFNQECYKQIFDFKTIDEYAPTDMKPNDDLDIQLAWLDLLIEKGFDFDASDLLEKFIDCYKFDFSEYGYAKRNYKRGILPPLSGSYNNYFASCMGCPIRAEVWSIVACGNMDLALKLAAMDGSIDHGPNSINAEMWISAVQTLSYTCKDILKIIQDSLTYLPSDSLTYQAVKSVVDAYIAKMPWRDVVENLHRTYGCADGTYVVINMAIIAAGLLYGGDNFNDVMTLALNAGYDTDCTCATAGSIYAMVYGIDGIEKKWVDLADKEIVTATENLVHQFKDFDQLADETMRVIIYAAENGINPDLKITGTEGIERLHPHTTKKIAKFDVEYADGVELAVGDKKEVKVLVTNIDSVDHDYKIKLAIPEGLSVSCDTESIKVKAGETKSFTMEAQLKVINDDTVNENNVIDVTLTDGKETISRKVGFVGAPVFVLSNAYYDGFNMVGKEDIDALPDDLVREWGGKKYLYHTDCNEYTNNWLRYDYEYISENWTDEYFDKKFKEFLPYTAKNDFIRIEEQNNMIGPCVIYALQKIEMAEDEKLELHIGSSDPYKLWINGQLVAEQKQNWFFSPYNQRPRYTFKKGINRIAIKLIRPGARQEFAYVLRKDPFNHVGAIKTDNKYKLL